MVMKTVGGGGLQKDRKTKRGKRQPGKTDSLPFGEKGQDRKIGEKWPNTRMLDGRAKKRGIVIQRLHQKKKTQRNKK